MATLKTQPNEQSVDAFIDGIEAEIKRDDSRAIIRMMSELTGEPPVMWGNSIIGFGSYHLKYESGRELDWFLTGFSPRKQNMTVYLGCKSDEEPSLLEKLGKHKTGVGCLYFKKLDDVDQSVLKQLIESSISELKKRYAAYN